MNVFVECNPDEILVKSLGIPKRVLFHNNDKGRVCNSLEMKHTNCIGIVDEDPRSSQPTYISKLIVKEDNHRVRILVDIKRNNKLIVICPRLEEWILDVTRKEKLDLSDFGLSSNISELHKYLGSKPEKLKEVITKLLANKSPAILYLQSQLSTLPNSSLTKYPNHAV